MSKKNNMPQYDLTSAPPITFPTFPTLPAGYAEQSDHVVGFWDPTQGPIHFVPTGAYLSDSKVDSKKPSILIVGTLVDACPLVPPRGNDDNDDALVQGRPGDKVGIWGKAGMASLRNLATQSVFMYRSGERDVGRQLPMKTFMVAAPGPGLPIPVLADRRRTSLGARTWLTEPLANRPTAPEGECEKLPF